jgi:hypothetical protein
VEMADLKRVLAGFCIAGVIAGCAMVLPARARDDIDQVLPLADILAERADHFRFDRLSAVGQGDTRRCRPGKNSKRPCNPTKLPRLPPSCRLPGLPGGGQGRGPRHFQG